MQEFITIPVDLINVLHVDKPYSKLEALMDIFVMANEAGGEFEASRRKLENRWGWSSSKVISFLSMLEEKTIIEPKKNQKRTTIKPIKSGFLGCQGTKKEPKKNQEKTNKNTSLTISTKDAIYKVIEEWNGLYPYGIDMITENDLSDMKYQNFIKIAKAYSVSDIMQTIGMIKNSEFLQGKKTDFKVTFDWFLIMHNYEKIRSGK